MVSSQYGTVFTKSHYGKIKKVYSIWICTDPPKYRQNTIDRYAVSEENCVGEIKEPKRNYDLLSALMICLGDPQKGESQGILQSLQNIMKNMNLTVKEAMDALEIKEEERSRYTELLKKYHKQ